jgi:RNA polymerase sigma-70 factor (ECF subfamily)
MDQESPPRELAVEQYRNYLLLLARMQLGQHLQAKLDASDVVQQTMLEAHRQRPMFRGSSTPQFLAWLRRLLAGTLADAVKNLNRAKRDVARERSLEAALDQSAEQLGAWLAADQSSPSEQADRHEQAAILAGVLMQLPEAQRQALVLRHCQGLSVAEISEQIGRSPTAVAGLLKRGSRQLRVLMSDRGQDP